MNDVQNAPERVLIVGRSPSVLIEAVETLRTRGYTADATNEFDRVLEDYDVTKLDVLVFGGMVPPDTKQQLRDTIAERNPDVAFVQGLAGIAGVIAAQVQGLASVDDASVDITFDDAHRSVGFRLDEAMHVTVDAWWATSWTPPEPTSTSMVVWDGDLDAGPHEIAIPGDVPAVASFAAVTLGSIVRVFTIGAMPVAVTRMVPRSASDKRLPDVSQVTTQSDIQ